MTNTDSIFYTLYGEKIDPTLSKAFEDALNDPSKWFDWCLAHADECDKKTCPDFLQEPFKICEMPASIVDEYGFDYISKNMTTGELDID